MPLTLLGLRRWKAVGGFCISSVTLVLTSALMVGAQGVRNYIQLFLGDAEFVVNHDPAMFHHNWRGMAGRFSAFMHYLGHDTPAWVPLVSLVALSCISLLLLIDAWRYHYKDEKSYFELVFSLTIAISLLISPHTFDHDLSLLVLVAVLVAPHLHRGRVSTIPQFVVIGGHVLFFVVLSFGGPLVSYLVYPQISVAVLALLATVIWHNLRGQMWFSPTDARALPLTKKRNPLRAQTRKTAIWTGTRSNHMHGDGSVEGSTFLRLTDDESSQQNQLQAHEMYKFWVPWALGLVYAWLFNSRRERPSRLREHRTDSAAGAYRASTDRLRMTFD